VTWQDIFLTRGELRPIWRCLLAVVMMLAAYVAVGMVLGTLYEGLHWQPRLLTTLLLVNCLLLPCLLGVFKIMTGVFDHKPLGSAGLAFHRYAGKEMGLGLALGTAMMLAVAALERVLGLVTFHAGAGPPRQFMAGGAFLLLVLLVAAANEEMLFRGYAFQRLVDSVGAIAAVALFSLLFGLSHLANPAHTWVSTANTMLVGVPFAVAYLRSRSLWIPIGMHFAWNFIQGFVLGFQVSGLTFPFSLWQAEVGGADWLTGGRYGPEGGLVATAVIVLATGYVLVTKRIYVSDGVKRLLAEDSQERKELRELSLGVGEKPGTSQGD
jgi:membrane protease YdiL (CAAX protease family)